MQGNGQMKNRQLIGLRFSGFAFIALTVIAIAIAERSQSADVQNNPAGALAKHASDPQALEAEMVNRNGGIFEGWPAPKLALVFTGLQDGYLEPCGCSGKENQLGGLSRRDRLLARLESQKWPLIALDVGGQVRRFGHQQELKFEATADALKKMGYQAVGFSPEDLRLDGNELFATVAPVGNQSSPFVSANVSFIIDDKALPKFKVLQAGGKKIGVTTVLGDSNRGKIGNNILKFQGAAAALTEVLPKLQEAKCDLLVLLANASRDESIALAKKFPQFNIVMTSGGAEVPPKDATPIEGTKTKLIEVGGKGMYAIVLGLFDDPADPIRYQRVPLDARFGESTRMKQVMAAYQDQLKELGLEGLGIKPSIHTSGRTFVGTKACAECHSKAYAVWKKTPHSKALETLVNLDPPRQFDAECLSCHVTGWEPQKFYPFVGGFRSLEKTPELAGNGCENCHGPGSKHVAAERGEAKATEADLERLRKEMHLSIKTDAEKRKVLDNCLQCHDGDNSLEFHGGEAFDKYWPKVEHHGKD